VPDGDDHDLFDVDSVDDREREALKHPPSERVVQRWRQFRPCLNQKKGTANVRNKAFPKADLSLAIPVASLLEFGDRLSGQNNRLQDLFR